MSVTFQIASMPEYCYSKITVFEVSLVLLWKGERTWITWWDFTQGAALPERGKNSGEGPKFTTIKGRWGLLGNEETSADVDVDIKERKRFGSKLIGQLVEMQIQTTLSCHVSAMGLGNIKMFDDILWWWGCGASATSCTAGRNGTRQNTQRWNFDISLEERTCALTLWASNTLSGRQARRYQQDRKYLC